MTTDEPLPRTRRSRSSNRLALAAATALVGLLAAACGSSAASGGGPSAAAAAPASSAPAQDVTASSSSAAAFPVSITHQFGTTIIDQAPIRVVSAGYTEHDTLLALGVIPVGVTDWYGDHPYATWPWAQDELGDATPEVLSLADGFQFEKIAALEPDLIVGTNAGMTAEDYAKLSAIAPTIAQSGQWSDFFEPWYLQSAAIGKAVGKEPEVTALIDDVRGQFAAAAAANPEFAGTPAIFMQNAVYDGSVIAYQKGLSTDFLTDLGFDVPADIDAFATEGGQAYIPVEQISVLNSADVLIWGTESDTDKADLEQVPLFTSLTAVQAGRSIYTGGELAGAIYFTSPLSLPYVLATLVPQLAAVL